MWKPVMWRAATPVTVLLVCIIAYHYILNDAPKVTWVQVWVPNPPTPVPWSMLRINHPVKLPPEEFVKLFAISKLNHGRVLGTVSLNQGHLQPSFMHSQGLSHAVVADVHAACRPCGICGDLKLTYLWGERNASHQRQQQPFVTTSLSSRIQLRIFNLTVSELVKMPSTQALLVLLIPQAG